MLESLVLMKIPQVSIVSALLMLASVWEKTNVWIAMPVVVFMVFRVLFDAKKNQTLITAMIVTCSLVGLGRQTTSIPFLILLLMWDTDRIHPKFGLVNAFMDRFCELMAEVNLPFTSPLYGVNSASFFDDWVNGYKEAVQGVTMSSECRAEFIRPNGINDVVIDYATKPFAQAAEASEKFDRYAQMWRVGIMALTGAVSYMLLGFAGLFTCMATVGVMMMENEVQMKIDEKQSGACLKSGVYLITQSIFGLTYDRGIGVVMDGVLHTPLHVSRAYPLRYGNGLYKPYLTDPKGDLVTYGGPPSFTKITPDDEVFVNCETEVTRVTYRVKINVQGDNLSWVGVTKPGESGSPVFVRREEDKLELVALAGRFVNETGTPTEFATNVHAEKSAENSVRKIVSGCGSGKTRRVIPQLVREGIAKLKGKRVLVTGPTRVVCKEIYQAMRSDFNVGLNIKDAGNRRSPNAPVQIAAHATALGMLHRQDYPVRGVGMIIIDEAHQDDPTTKLLRDFARSLLNDGVQVVEMSATLDGEVNRDSNHYIHELETMDVVGTVVEQLAKEKKFMAFVTSKDSAECKKLMSIDTHKIMLCRDTYSSVAPELNNPDVRLVVTTDIAEVGINVPDLDVVVDGGKKFAYTVEGKIVSGSVIDVSPASYVQRRGRVGRQKPGIYYTKRFANPRPVVTASEIDADILGTGRKWSTRTNDWGVSLSDKQFEKWLEGGYTPTWTYLVYDSLGNPRDQKTRQLILSSWKGEGFYYIGCEDKNCPCAGSYQFFDERNHDLMFPKNVLN